MTAPQDTRDLSLAEWARRGVPMTRSAPFLPPDYDAAGRAVVAEIATRLGWLDADLRQAARERIRRDPQAHKLTREMEGHAGYRYWPGGKDGRGRTVRFAYSTGRNLAGYYLTWREVVTKDGTGKRDQWAARKVRRKAAEMAKQRAERFREQQKARREGAR